MIVKKIGRHHEILKILPIPPDRVVTIVFVTKYFLWNI